MDQQNLEPCHPFGKLLRTHLNRKSGLTQTKLAEGIRQYPFVITVMSQGKRLSGKKARQRMVAMIDWLHNAGVLFSLDEANALLSAGHQPPLRADDPSEGKLIRTIAGDTSSASGVPDLPQPASSFVGRNQERLQLLDLIRVARMVTIMGPGGAGKTRLALDVATQARQHFSGVCWVDLAPLNDASLLLPALAQALHFDGPFNDSIDPLLHFVHTKALLILLDNCEHLIDACVPVITRFLRACPSLRILATSRELLGVDGEVTFRIPAMSYPIPPDGVSSIKDREWEHENERLIQNEYPIGSREAGALYTYDAVRLFVERARRICPTFELTRTTAKPVLEICRQLEGNPLAIEMAAASMAHFNDVAQIEPLIDQKTLVLRSNSRTAPERHQTISAAIDWSISLLSDAERALLQRLAVFAGGWLLEDALAICALESISPPIPEPAAASHPLVRILTGLVEKSLVTVEVYEEQRRYRFQEIVRHEVARGFNDSTEHDLLCNRHAAWFSSVARRAGEELAGPQQAYWLHRLAVDHDNLRAALRWLLEHDPSAGAQMALDLTRFWHLRGYLGEGRSWFTRLLVHTTAVPVQLQAKLLRAAGEFAGHQADLTQAKLLFNQAYAIAIQMEDRGEQIDLLVWLGEINVHQSNLTSALANYQEALRLATEAHDLSRQAELHFNLARFELRHGNYPLAQAYTERRLELVTGLGNKRKMAEALQMLGDIHRRRHDRSPRSFYLDSLAYYQELGDHAGIAANTYRLASLAKQEGQEGEAETLYAESLATYKALGDKQGYARLLKMQAGWHVKQGEYAGAKELYAQSMALFHELPNKWEIASITVATGDLELHLNHPKAAHDAYQHALKLYAELHDRMSIADTSLNLGDLALRTKQCARAYEHYCAALEHYRSQGYQPGYAKCLLAFAQYLASRNAPGKAAILAAAATTLLNHCGIEKPDAFVPDYAPLLATLRASLGDRQFRLLWQEGQQQSFEEVLALINNDKKP